MPSARRPAVVVALVAAVAMAFSASAGSAGANEISKKQKAAVGQLLREQIKKDPQVDSQQELPAPGGPCRLPSAGHDPPPR